MTRLSFLAAVCTAMISIAPLAFAADEYNVGNGLTLNGNPLGMHGFDPASMFSDDAPRIGDAEFTSTFDGVDYYFATAQTKAAFDANPAAILPSSATSAPSEFSLARSSTATCAMPTSSTASSTSS